MLALDLVVTSRELQTEWQLVAMLMRCYQRDCGESKLVNIGEQVVLTKRMEKSREGVMLTIISLKEFPEIFHGIHTTKDQI